MQSTRPGRTNELRWRLVVDAPRNGAENMALDHALAARLAPGEGVVRLYGWSRPTVSFGKNEPAVGVQHDPEDDDRPKSCRDYVRRPTGGRAVLHDDELTYAVVAPLDAFGGLREAYLAINRTIALALVSLGADARVVDVDGRAEGRVSSLDAGPCFLTPAPGEIVVGSRKLVGSAQARLEGVLLQHGSVLLGGDQRLLGGTGTDSVTLGEVLGEVTRKAVVAATERALRYSFGGAWNDWGHSSEYRADELAAAERLEVERYGCSEWTWRR